MYVQLTIVLVSFVSGMHFIPTDSIIIVDNVI